MRAPGSHRQTPVMQRSRSELLVDVGIQAAAWLVVGTLLAVAALTIRPSGGGDSDREAGPTARAAPAAELGRPTSTAAVYLVFDSEDAAQTSNSLVHARTGAIATTAVVVPDDHAFLTLATMLLSEVACPPSSCGPVLLLDLRAY